MNILALDTATAACSAALLRGPEIAAARFEVLATGHAERLMPMIAEVMAEADVEYEALDRIGVTIGPGTFTGLRIGLAAARGLALAVGCPAIGVTTLEALATALAHRSPIPGRIIAAIDARRDQVYAQAFDGRLTPLSEPAAMAVADAARLAGDEPVRVVGTGAPGVVDRLRSMHRRVEAVEAGVYPDAAVVARMAAARDPVPDAMPAPLYLRPPDAVRPEKPVRRWPT